MAESAAHISSLRQYTLEEALKQASLLGSGRGASFTGMSGPVKAFFLASFLRRFKRPALAILADDEDAEAFRDSLAFFLNEEEVFLYPSTELLPFDEQSVHPDIRSSRLALLHRLLDKDALPFITVASFGSLLERVAPREALSSSVVELKVKEEFDRERLISRLAELGYSRMSFVEERGEMSARGGLLDVFPPAFAQPLRIEFLGDEIESIRLFDISSQRALKELKDARILPVAGALLSGQSRYAARDALIERAEELGMGRDSWEGVSRRLIDSAPSELTDALLPLFYKRLVPLFDYLRDNTAIAVIDPERVDSGMKEFNESVKAAAQGLESKKEFFVAPESLYLGLEEAKALIKGHPVISMGHSGAAVACCSNLGLKQALSIGKKTEQPLKPLADKIQTWKEEGFRVYITAHNAGQAMRTKELLEGYGLNPLVIKGTDVLDSGKTAGWLFVATGRLSEGFSLPAERLTVVSEEEVFGERVKRRPPPKKKLGEFLMELQDMSAGDHVVHKEHGIGVYRGLKRLDVEGIESEFILVEYRGNDRLYVPVVRADLISRYKGAEGSAPELDRLGGANWARTKGRVKKAVGILAGELLKLYAERLVAAGFAFPPPDSLFREFEAGFEYDETPDQARAIEECLSDMQGEKPMDRLICGDVGYGKTEVAIRAAFLAAQGGRQTAVLVPTTVLAQQHFQTFSARLAPYPATVDVLSRFRSKKEHKETLERLKKGGVDIIIGTHMLLQKDVVFKNLGLVIIDEEHRFGVRQKERFKSMKKTVDVLAMTATPIPRTLQMSLASVRDLSIINTPPEDRLAIKTTIIRFDENLIREAIERELKRGGQVFFVHNRIEDMGAVEELLQKLAPQAKIASAHGRMNVAELEKKMLGFVERRYDILLSTAIIESGLDIPAANTIIINRAHRFGLADLHQLRGRVGRSSHRAYAYFIVPDGTGLTEEAARRIEVIREHTEPGSGFNIAAYDLEIRGAGELLGREQSGQIAEVGFDMYAGLLEEAVHELKHEAVPDEAAPELNLKLSQFIPEDYMPDARQRLNFYKRLASASLEEDLSYIKDELLDRFGLYPEPVEHLLSCAGLKLLLKRLNASELVQKGARLYLTLADAPSP
ncbi:MAG: transcription-repair coupling factor, partial [Deltaproteobacteria bacterium]